MHETKPPTSGLTITCNINPSLSLSESFRSTPNHQMQLSRSAPSRCANNPLLFLSLVDRVLDLHRLVLLKA